jgi:HlyD family secretion protein
LRRQQSTFKNQQSKINGGIMHLNLKRIIPVILVLIAIIISVWWYTNNQQKNQVSQTLTASGTIEATEVIIAPELGGHVLEVLVDEGEPVTAGQVLVKLDDSLLQAQLSQAEAALAQAQANYNLVTAGPTSEQRQVSIASAQLELLNAQKAMDDLNNNADLLAAGAQLQIAQYDKAIDTATDIRDNLLNGADATYIDSAQASVTLLRDQLDKANDDYAPYINKPVDNLTRAYLLAKQSAAQIAYDNAVSRLNNLLGGVGSIDLALANANLSIAQAQMADAQRRYDILKNGPDPKDIALAQAAINLAQTHLDAAKANVSSEQTSLAKSQVDVARAALEVVQVQIKKMIITAPIDGVVLTRSIEPGEVAAAGAPLLNLARLDKLTLTIYLPEDRYGTIILGQQAKVSVDSFPGQSFSAIVVHIADQAEFTPRNVQTAEGRRTTVFAVKLTVDNPDGKLKPGMPADLSFTQ